MFRFLNRTFSGYLLRVQLSLLSRLFSSLFSALIQPRTKRVSKKSRTDAEEARRMAGCREVVLEYAEALGFIARECITRDELEKLINDGITPEELAAEIQRRIDARPGVVLGNYHFANGATAIKLPDSLRDRHMYIIGKSGSGKTNLIRVMAMQDIFAGNGIGMLAPEQELLTDEIMPYIPEARLDDVVYFNPADSTNPIPLNPLYLDDEADIDHCVDDILTIFKRLMGESQVRMDEILRQSLYALLERPNSTLLDVDRLLSRTDDTFRNEIVRTTTDEQTRYFFESTYPSFPKDAHLPITTRINRLVRPRAVRSLLCQPGRSFDFRKAMDEGKILLFNLSDGILGEQTSQLLGQLIVSKIQLATLSRMDTDKAERRPFYFYLDEFQAYCGVAEASYSRLLSRGRKYAFGLILAHQQTSQLTKDILDNILGNVTSIVTFSVAYGDATRLSQQYIVERGREKRPLPTEEFVNQKIGEAIGKINQTVFKLSVPLAPQQPNRQRTQYIIARSAQNYGLNGVPMEARVKRSTPVALPPPDTNGKKVLPGEVF